MTNRITNKIKVVLKKPMKKPEIVEIGSDLKSMQDAVGGLIEQVMPFDEEVALVCNEEGKILEFPLNRAVKRKNGEIIDIIAGDLFICNAKGESLAYLSDEQLKRYSEMYQNPERFYRINGEIKAVPVSVNKNKDYER